MIRRLQMNTRSWQQSDRVIITMRPSSLEDMYLPLQMMEMYMNTHC